MILKGKKDEATRDQDVKPCFCRKGCSANGILKTPSPALRSCGSTRVTKIEVPGAPDDDLSRNRAIKIQVSRNKIKKRPFKPAPARYTPRSLRTKSHPIPKFIAEKPLSPPAPPREPCLESETDSINAPWSEILAKHSRIPSNDVLPSESDNDRRRFTSRRVLSKDRGSQTFNFDKVVETVNLENIYVKNQGVQCRLSRDKGSEFTISCFEEALLQKLISRFKEDLKIARREPGDCQWRSAQGKSSEISRNDLLEAQKEIEKLKNQIEEKSQELIDSKKRETELKIAVSEAQKRVDTMGAQFAEFRQMIVTNTERVRQLQAENRALRRSEQALPEAVEEVDRLRTELSLVSLDRDKARAYLSLKEEEIAHLKRRLDKETGYYAEIFGKPQVTEEPPTAVASPKERPQTKTKAFPPPSRSTSTASIETLKATLTEVFDMIKKSAETMVKEAEFRQGNSTRANESGDFSEGCYPSEAISLPSP